MQKKKSKAKRIGLGAVHVLPQSKVEIYANEKKGMQRDREIDEKNQVEMVCTPSHFTSVEDNGNILKVKKGKITTCMEDPRRRKRPDTLGITAGLERRYFQGVPESGFEDDMHRQVCAKIVDISKELSFHINNVLFCVNDLIGDPQSDLLSSLNVSYDLQYLSAPGHARQQKLFERLLHNEKRIIFPSAFYNISYKNGKKVYTPKSEEEVFQLLCVLGQIRQNAAHGDEENEAPIFNYTSDFLNAIYRKKIEEINKGFLNTTDVDFAILFKLFHATEEKVIYQNYYSFLIRKDYKNIGISIKKLRECILDKSEQVYGSSRSKAPFNNLRSTVHDSYRGRLYRLIDFLLYDHYSLQDKEKETLNALIESLRAAENELEKDKIYRTEAAKCWKWLCGYNAEENRFDWKNGYLYGEGHILRLLDKGKGVKTLKKENCAPVDTGAFSGIMITDEANPFSKLIFLLTLFLDAKEIREMFSELSNHFAGIQSFWDKLTELGLSSRNNAFGLKKKYHLFTEAGKIAEELRLIQNFAVMDRPEPTQRALYVEAARLLGTNKSDEELKNEFHDIFETKKGSDARSHRNFILNNVIISKRFLYVIKYSDAESLRKLGQNRNAMAFALHEIPELQIRRYWYSTKQEDENDVDTLDAMRAKLLKKILGLNFSSFEGAKQNEKDEAKKLRYKNLIGLYLILVYHIVKNLIYCNSRYFLAFRCQELEINVSGWKGNTKDYLEIADFYREKRESEIKDREKILSGKSRKNRKKQEKLLQTQGEYLSHLEKTLQNAGYSKGNEENGNLHFNVPITEFRNTIEHLNAIREAGRLLDGVGTVTSWFALYHYAVQKDVFEKVQSKTDYKRKEFQTVYKREEFQTVYGWFDSLTDHHGYSKNLLKLLCMPFSYQRSRYNPLVLERQFDKNRPPEEKEEEVEEQLTEKNP